MNLIDGKAVSASVKEQIRAEIERDKLDIGLAVIIVCLLYTSRCV